MIYNLGLFSNVGNGIVQALRTFGGYIAATIYELLAYLYNIFTLLGTAEILDNDFVNAIYRKVGMILGLFMLFKLIFSLIQSLVDPNNLTDSKKGAAAIVKRLVIAIVLLGTTPFIFSEAFKIQRLLIGADSSTDNVLYKLIVGGNTGVNINNFGRVLASNMFFTFYTDEDYPFYDNGKAEYNEELDERYQDLNYASLKESIEDGESFYTAVDPLSFRRDGTYAIEFNFLLILIVGVALLYIVFMFCFQAAARVFQLAFLQLIAPIPILSYISDPDGTFKKWVNKCLWTFLDLFIRLAIIYFVIYLSTYVFGQFDDANSILMQSLGDINWYTEILIKAFLILGLFMFANKVPNLLKEIFPSMGGGGFNLGLNPKKDVIEPIKSAYNSTPLGWAPKALGWAGKKSIGAIDRKVHNLPKPRNKVQQYFDKLAPGHAEAAKYRDEKRKFDNSMKQGENLAKRMSDLGINDLNGETSINDFTSLGFSEAYANAYKNESIASDNVNKIKKALAEAQARGDSEAVGRLTADLGSAERAHTKAKEALDYQAGQHKKDAEMMSSYKLYKSRTKSIETWEDTPTSQPAPQPSFQQSSDSPQIIVPDTVNSGNLSLDEMDRRQQAHETIQQEVADTNTVVTDRINNATNLSDTQRATAESLQQELANLISYKEQARDQKDRAEIDRDIQKVQAELDKLLK